MNINILPPPDTNANGLADDWEAAYGVSDPAADTDGDGLSNLEEYQANTNPTNAASAFRILSFTPLSDGKFACVWSAVGGTRYRMQFANGSGGGALPPVFADITRSLTNEMDASPWGEISTQWFTDDFTLTGGPATNEARYYRVRLVK
jgi:hypothetical protein